MALQRKNLFGFGEKKVTHQRKASSTSERRAEARAIAKREKTKQREEIAWQKELQHDYAYNMGASNKRAGWKPQKASQVTLESAKKVLGLEKATKLAHSAYMAGYRQNPSKKKTRNPELGAAELAEAWHGRPAKSSTEYVEKIHVHEYLTDLGQLAELEVSADGRHKQKIFFDEDTRLASSENGKQLYVVGGDQTLDLKALGITGDEAEKDLVVIGEVCSLTYVTSKDHLGKADRVQGPYMHELGEDGGTYPTMLYDTMNGTIGFAGGSYKIDPTDYDGRHSAGIRN